MRRIIFPIALLLAGSLLLQSCMFSMRAQGYNKVTQMYDEVRGERKVALQLYHREAKGDVKLYGHYSASCNYIKTETVGGAQISINCVLRSPTHSPAIDPTLYVVGSPIALPSQLDITRLEHREQYVTNVETTESLDSAGRVIDVDTEQTSYTKRWLDQYFSGELTTEQLQLIENQPNPYLRIYAGKQAITFPLKPKYKRLLAALRER